MQRNEGPIGELSLNNIHPYFYTILASEEFSHEYDIPLTTLISVAQGCQDKSIQSIFQHIIKATDKQQVHTV